MREEITIRPARPEDAAGIAKVHVDTWRTTYSGIVPDDYLASLSYERHEQGWTRQIKEAAEGNIFIYVAEDNEGRIVGFVSGGPNRNPDPVYKGELYAIYILQAYQGLGIGRKLTLALAQSLFEAGLDSMILWVLAKNPARRFYESLGGQLVKSGQFEISGVTIEEVAYGWPDIRTLLEDSRQ